MRPLWKGSWREAMLVKTFLLWTKVQVSCMTTSTIKNDPISVLIHSKRISIIFFLKIWTNYPCPWHNAPNGYTPTMLLCISPTLAGRSNLRTRVGFLLRKPLNSSENRTSLRKSGLPKCIDNIKAQYWTLIVLFIQFKCFQYCRESHNFLAFFSKSFNLYSV